LKIPIVLVVGARKTKSEALGYCGVPQIWRKMKHKLEV
jgi:hypothetical protein